MVSAGGKSKGTMLLSTKLKMPRPRRDYVVRRSLFEKLKRCSEMSVIFIKGAAGMGKTTLLSSFILETGLKNTGWLSLDETDDGILPFWHYFAAAAGSALGEKIGFGTLLPLFEPHDPKDMLIALINRLCGDRELYLVLDDFHCVRESALIDSLEFFLQSMPENLHLFLLSREDPPVYLGALAVSGRLLYLSGDDMKFSREESMSFLKTTMKLKADDAELEKISGFAEGWVGGLQLAAAGGCFSGGLLTRGSGFASEYLTREVFGRLNPEEQDFLVRTGNLSWFSEEICSGLIDHLDFASMLESLLEKNLFLICIDEDKGIYCYHNILSEYLKRKFAELPEREQGEILRKAARGFEEEEDYGEAARLLIEAKEYGEAVKDLLRMTADTEAGEYISRIPISFIVENINLVVRGLIYNLGLGNMEKFEELCHAAVVQWEHTPFCGVLHYAQRILDKSGTADPPPPFSINDVERYEMQPETASLILLGTANLMVMDRQYWTAKRYVDRAQEIYPDVSHDYIYALKAQLDEETGLLNDALKNYGRIREIHENSASLFMEEYDYHIGIAGVYLKRMELSKAKEALMTAEKLSTRVNIPERMIRCSLSYNWAEYDILNGEAEKAAELTERILESSDVLLWVDRLLLELAAADCMQPGLKEKILREYHDLCGTGKETVSPAYKLLCARLYLQKGDLEEARKITNGVLAFSRENQNRLHLVNADLLLLRMTDDSAPADSRRKNNLLREAVYYSWENRILQPFYLERASLLPLLSGLAARPAEKNSMTVQESAFVRDVISVCGGRAPAAQGAEALSAREVEVLGELSLGITNREIAEKLCISQATVKTHVLSIFGKLGVSSRILAVEQGRKKGLIR